MALLPILRFPDPRLHTVAKPVAEVDERIRRLKVSLENPGTLLIAFDASLFHDDWSGSIEYRFHTSQAQAFLDALKARIA